MRPPKKRRGRKSTRRARIVQGYLERKPRKLLESQYEVIESLLPHRSGVYSLYDRGELYYIGIARNLMTRLWHHTKDKHARKWDAFSLYASKSWKQIGTHEALFLRIAKPPGNGQVPSLGGGAEDLTGELRQHARDVHQLLKSQRL